VVYFSPTPSVSYPALPACTILWRPVGNRGEALTVLDTIGEAEILVLRFNDRVSVKSRAMMESML